MKTVGYGIELAVRDMEYKLYDPGDPTPTPETACNGNDP